MYIRKYKPYQHIKSFNESIEQNPRDVKFDIKDILSPVSDLNLRVIVRLEFAKYSVISIRIESEWADGEVYPFKWDDIKDDFLRIFDYLDYLEGQYVSGKIYYKEVQEDGRIFNRYNKETLYLDDFISHINNSNKKLYSLSLQLFKYVESDKNWYKIYE